MEKIKSQEENCHLDDITDAPREIVFIVIARRNVDFRTWQRTHLCKSYDSGVYVSYGIFKNMVGTLTDLSNIFSFSDPISFSLVKHHLGQVFVVKHSRCC